MNATRRHRLAGVFALPIAVLVAACSGSTDAGGASTPPGPRWSGAAQQVSVGAETNCALADGGVWCWGNPVTYEFPVDLPVGNYDAECIDPTSGLPKYQWPCTVAYPVRVSTQPFTWIRVQAQFGPLCGMDASGSAWCWDNGRYLELPAAATLNANGRYDCPGAPCRLTPWKVRAPAALLDYSNNGDVACAVTTAHKLLCMSPFNGYGQVGNPSVTGTDTLVPVASAVLFNRVSVSKWREWSCALSTTGKAYCWGQNESGQLGNGAWDDKNVPTPVAGTVTFASLESGIMHACGLTAAGAAYCWGRGGLLGTGNNIDTPTPTAVTGGHTFTSIAVGYLHACGLDPAGAAWCWGDDYYGQLGVDWSTGCPGGVSGVDHCSPSPVPVNGGLQFKSLAAGMAQTCGITVSNEIWCWGMGLQGQSGTGYDAPRGNRIHPFKVVTQ